MSSKTNKVGLTVYDSLLFEAGEVNCLQCILSTVASVEAAILSLPVCNCITPAIGRFPVSYVMVDTQYTHHALGYTELS